MKSLFVILLAFLINYASIHSNHIPSSRTIRSKANLQRKSIRFSEKKDLPENYDCRSAYPRCRSISETKNWLLTDDSDLSISIAMAFSDRLCIRSGETLDFDLSIDQLTSCVIRENLNLTTTQLMSQAWKYIKRNGLVTKKNYNSIEGCRTLFSYDWGEDLHESEDLWDKLWDFWNKLLNDSNTIREKCCKIPDTMKAYKATNIKKLPANEEQIRKEIYENGPVTATFTIYDSFNRYKEGIYFRNHDELDEPTIFDLAVRVIGWGLQDNITYWLIANPWQTEWTENGIFRIIRGIDECGIESNMFAGLPIL